MPRPFLDTSPARLIREFSWNVGTAHALTRAAAPIMLETGGGAVVGISSMMGRTAGRGFVAYGTAKAALSHWTRLAAQDLAPRIRVNAIAVGSIATSALEIVLEDDELRTAMEESTPLRRIGDPEEIAATVLYLASAAGGYVTGKVVEVDGGIEQPNLDLGLPDLYARHYWAARHRRHLSPRLEADLLSAGERVRRVSRVASTRWARWRL